MHVFYMQGFFVYEPNQWEMTFQYNAISHWLDAYTGYVAGLFLLYALLGVDSCTISLCNNTVSYNDISHWDEKGEIWLRLQT